MASRHRVSKLAIALAAVTLGATAIAFTVDGSPTPRPWYLFAGVAAALTLLAVGVGRGASELTLAAGTYVVVMSGFFLRTSPFVRVVSSGLDYGRWLQYATKLIATGSFSDGSDMYIASPLYIFDLVVADWVMGGPAYASRFFTVTVASLLPLLVGVLAYRVSERAEVGYLAVALSASAPLFFRTSALLESESIALPWFVLGVYLFVRSLRTSDRRYHGLFLLVAGTAVMVHFFYGTVLYATIVGALAAWYALRRTAVVRFPSGVAGFRLGLGVTAVGVVTTSWILWSLYAHTAVLTLQSATSIQSLSQPLAIFIPSSGSTGASIGAASGGSAGPASGGGGGSPSSPLVGLFPVIGLLSVASVGAVFAYRKWPQSHIGLVLAAIVSGMGVLATLAGLDYDLGFRMYYFVTIFAVLFASVALAVGLRSERWGRWRPLVVGAVVVVFFSYALISPATPIGNNVDPKLGGNSWKMTETEHDQLRQLEGQFRETSIENRLSQTHEYFLPGGTSSANQSGTDRSLYIGTADCGAAARVSDTGGYSICLPNASETTDRPAERAPIRRGVIGSPAVVSGSS